jgi:hypothetical protein
VGEIYGSHNVSILALEVETRRFGLDKEVDAENAPFSSRIGSSLVILSIFLLPDGLRRSCIKCRLDYPSFGPPGSPLSYRSLKEN